MDTSQRSSRKIRAFSAGSAVSLLLILLVIGVSFFSSRAYASSTSASDSFTRTVTGGWGSADMGGTYTVIGSSTDLSVNGSQGVMLLSGTGSTNQRGARLDSVSATNVDETVRIMLTTLPTSTWDIAYLIGRHVSGGNEYRARVRVDTTGGIHLQASVLSGGTETFLGSEATVSGLVAPSNTFFDVHFELSGTNPTTVLIRSWADGTAEPTTWNYSVTDSTTAVQAAGSVGLIARAGSNVPLNYVYDDLLVTNSDSTATATPTSALAATATPTSAPAATSTPTSAPLATDTPTSAALPTDTPTSAPAATNTPTPLPATATPTPTSSSTDPVVVAAGDIACGTGSKGAACLQQYTANLIAQIAPVAVLPLGDTQYEKGALSDFNTYYDPTWGAFKSLTHPSVGNHEYGTTNAQGYFDYFDGVGNQTGPAGDRTKGYYSYNLGSWHLVVLNTDCSKIGGCGSGSPQETWLKADLAANAGKCIMAYSHFPMFSSGQQPHNSGVNPLFLDLYNAHAAIYLTGHDHDYERFYPSNPSGGITSNGVVQFVVGTGGRNLTSLSSNGLLANSAIFDSTTFGVIKFTLHASSYDWVFMPATTPGFKNGTFTDSGTASCP